MPARLGTLSERAGGQGEQRHPGLAEQSTAPDCLQRSLLRRARLRQEVSASVDMTSDVKTSRKIFMACLAY